MAAFSTKLGPGTLTLGETTSLMDASCQLANGALAWDKDADDDLTVLCGDVVPGAVTYTAALSGTFLQDLSEEDGLVAYTWVNKGKSVPFTFTPNTAAGATVTGMVTIDPLDVGSTDDYGAVMSSDFEWACVGEPTLAWGASLAVDAAADDTDPMTTDATVTPPPAAQQAAQQAAPAAEPAAEPEPATV